MGYTKRGLLTFDDLCDYYNGHKNVVHYNAEKNNDNGVIVQLEANLTFAEDKYDPEIGLLPIHLKSCHIGDNRNRSDIKKDVMEEATPSIYNRPILGYIHKLSDGSYDFAGHEMYIDEEGNVVYEEVPVGIVPESGNATLIYDEDMDKTYLEVDGFIFEEYSKAAEILKEKGEAKVSVELALQDYSYNPKENLLIINRFYFCGITILGKSRDTEKIIEEGMAGSKVTLKDFKKNNSMFSNYSEEAHKSLIETLDKLNKTISNLNINANTCETQVFAEETLEEGGQGTVSKFEELLQKYNKTESDIEFEVEGLSDEELEAKFAEVFEETSGEETDPTSEEGEVTTHSSEDDEKEPETDEEPEDDSDEDPEDVENPEDDSTEPETTEPEVDPEDEDENEDFALIEKTFELDGRKANVSFELSHDDIRYALYELLTAYEEADNDWYYIREVYDDKFIYHGCCNRKIYGQKYVTNENDEVAFDGERYELFEELLTASEKAELDAMRSNYSSIVTELNSYKAEEAYIDKMTVFEDESYAQFLEEPEFKELMKREVADKYTKEELEDKANIAFSKVVKKIKNFSLESKQEEKTVGTFFFGKQEQTSSFLDGLLNIKK